MSQRVKVNDLIRATGLSRATVDRALNKRGSIHPHTERLIHEAHDRLRGGAADRQAPPVRLVARDIDCVTRFGRGLTEQIAVVRDREESRLDLLDMHDAEGDAVFALVRRLCEDPSRPLIIGVKNTEPVCDELARARRRGKRIVTMVTDLDARARDAYVSIDDRKAGQAAALLIGEGLRHRPAKVGVVLGDAAFRCHEDREIGFRSHLRAAYPNIVLADVVKGDDSAGKTRDATRALMTAHPDLDAVYNVAGGNAGLAEALEASGHAGRIAVVTHEANAITVPLARRGILRFLIAQSVDALLETAVRAARGGAGERHIIDFTIHTAFNLPAVDDLTPA